MFLFLSMLLSWFTCRMILFAKKAETIKKKLEFLCIQLLPFSIVFFPSSLFAWKKKRPKQKSLFEFCTLLYFYPSPFFPSANSFIPKSPKNSSVSLGCFSQSTDTGTGLALCWCLEQAEARKAGGSSLSVWDRDSVHGTELPQ